MPLSASVVRHGHAITDFVDQAGAAGLDLERMWNEPAAYARCIGQFALHQVASQGGHFLARDPLGINKLFYVAEPDGRLAYASYLFELTSRGHALETIWSVPSGHIAHIRPGHTTALKAFCELPYGDAETSDADDVKPYGAAIRQRLDAVFRAIARWSHGRKVYLTLSGGLDSTGIAVLAREHLTNVTAVTFAVASKEDPSGSRSEDLHNARRVADELGIELLPVFLRAEQLLEMLDLALVWGQDWRDFNVHCALVNAALAQSIQSHHRGRAETSRPILLTGDAGNELTIEYSPVTYKGKTYYDLPKIPAGRLRRSLVDGLDSGDREIGVFSRFGMDCIQPYGLAADPYVALPSNVLSRTGARRLILESIFGDAVPEFVYARPKTRAQEGSKDSGGGTLAMCVDAQIDSAQLRARFCELFGVDPKRLFSLIWGGRYKHELGRAE